MKRKPEHIIIKVGAANLDSLQELDYIRDDVDRSVKDKDFVILGAPQGDLGVAG
jgi:hypothetical protein